MIQLNALEVEQVLTPEEIIVSIKKGLIAELRGECYVPQRMHIDKGEETHLLMPAFGKKYNCTKLVSVIPRNSQVNLPVINGVVVLNNALNGLPVAIMDAPMITALRTGAVGAIGLEIISESDIENIGVIGCGVQGIWQTIFAAVLRNVKNVYCYSRSKDKYSDYQQKVIQYCPDIKITICDSPNNVVAKSQVIYTCTNSNNSVFDNNLDLITGKRFISIGSFKKDMQELPDCVYQTAHGLILDTESAKHEVGDVINALSKKLIKEDKVYTLQSMLAKNLRYSEKEPMVFKSVGSALFDLALASSIYEKVSANN